MEKVYNPNNIEDKWYKTWLEGKQFQPSDEQNTYCIMIPPPNITGSLHMGHAFQDSIMDTLIRYQRMRGNKTLWQVGTDHAGIATQMVVERNLNLEGTSRHALGREKFIDKVWQWKDKSGDNINQQLRRLGASVDWSRQRFTMDDAYCKAVQKVFIQLFEEGLIYRGKSLVNWDPVLLTAISDIEVESKEEQGKIWHINYQIADSNDKFTIATTRPETLLGDTAIAVNPTDSRYLHLIGKFAIVPIVGRKIPIIADDHVDPEFGTGVVKITPAHDFNDYAIGKRHNLELINIFTPDAKLNENVPEHLQHLDRFVARKKILEELSEKLVKTEDHTLKIPRGDRSNAIIEPYLTDQWFVKIAPLAEPAIAAVKQQDIQFVPSNWQKTYFEWMNNIQDWCISRQLWWGHRIPVWYDSKNNQYVGENEQHIRNKYQLADDVELNQDPDVLDTWFSSALWPFATLGWPEQTQELTDFYPTSVLVTGFDIIFFWVARMIMFGIKFTGNIPFKTVYIHGLIQDHNGQKMSKSKGNIIDPIDIIQGIDLDSLLAKRTANLMQPQMIDKIIKSTKQQFPEGIPAFGTDALRFTFCALATNGRHLRFDLKRIETNRNFCNKLWNAARYVLLNTENVGSSLTDGAKEYSLADEWILSIWQKCKTEIIDFYQKYRFDLIAQVLYEFIWHEYCDWYLELAKTILNDNTSPEMLRGTRYNLIHLLDEILRTIHPIMPFISEEIWEKIAPITSHDKKLLINHEYPLPDDNLYNDVSEQQISWVKSITLAIRNIRGEMNISPNKKLKILIQGGSNSDRENLSRCRSYLINIGNLNELEFLSDDVTPPECAINPCGDLQIMVPIQGLVDIDAETKRIRKEVTKLKKDLLKSQQKLENPNYISKAPSQVVINEQQKLKNLQSEIDKLETNLAKLAEM